LDKKIYCISKGEYSDWHIAYAFEDKKKRDALLEKLGNDHHKYDLKLSDGEIDVIIDSIKFFASIVFRIDDPDYFSVYFSNLGEEFLHLDGNDLSLFIKVTKDEYNEINEDNIDYGKYKKICSDYTAKIKYMREVEGLNDDQIMDIFNSK